MPPLLSDFISILLVEIKAQTCVQVGLKVGLSLTIFLEKKKETVNLSLR